jgi:hypothetical protein
MLSPDALLSETSKRMRGRTPENFRKKLRETGATAPVCAGLFDRSGTGLKRGISSSPCWSFNPLSFA